MRFSPDGGAPLNPYLRVSAPDRAGLESGGLAFFEALAIAVEVQLAVER
jgi:hypothetical protein